MAKKYVKPMIQNLGASAFNPAISRGPCGTGSDTGGGGNDCRTGPSVTSSCTSFGMGQSGSWCWPYGGGHRW